MEKTLSSPTQPPIHVNVIMACHNRVKITERFFNSFENANRDDFKFSFSVTNDGSKDGTRSLLESVLFDVEIYDGTGDLYWAKSMACAENLIDQVPDGILWVNDDLILRANAFDKLKEGIQAHPFSVLVGQVKDVEGDQLLYGGYRRVGRHPLVLELLETDLSYIEADTFNGNFVYIPIEIRLSVGAIDSRYQHAYADCDYGYRARKLGHEILVIPGIIGETNVNNPQWPSGRFQKIKQLLSKKHNPIKSQILFFFVHGSKWKLFEVPIFVIRPFLKIILLNSTKRIEPNRILRNETRI